MMFWIIAAVMAALVVIALLWPLMRRQGIAPAADDFDRAVYRDQLAELEQDLQRGLIEEKEAEAARREIERRLLQTADVGETSGEGSGSAWLQHLATVVVICLPPLLGVGLYLELGTPGLPGLPLAERDPGGPEELALLVQQLERRIATSPDEIEPRLVLAQVFERLGRFAAAAEAYRDAITVAEKHGPVPAPLHAALGETLVAADQGRVAREARLAFAAAIEADPGNVRARYYAGLAMAQDQKVESALEVWKTLAADLPADSPWLGVLRTQVGRAAAELGIEPPVIAGSPAPEAPAPEAPKPEIEASDGMPRGPSAADIEAAQEMTPEERQAFIRSMVAQLAERLEAEPADPEGWLRLARAYGVLGETGKAHEALTAAEAQIATLPEDSPQRGTLVQRLEAVRQSLP